MTSAKSLKEALELSFTSYKRSKFALNKAVSNFNDNSSTRTLSLKVTSLEESLDAVNACHTSWVSKTELTADELA